MNFKGCKFLLHANVKCMPRCVKIIQNDLFSLNNIPLLSLSTLSISILSHFTRRECHKIHRKKIQTGLMGSGQKHVTVKESLDKITNDLITGNIEDAKLQAEYIQAKAIGVERLKLYSELEKILSDDQLNATNKMVSCSLLRFPLQYILGDWDFHSICLNLNPPVFIPRPETEELVDMCLAQISMSEPVSIMEIGCGSGAISLALLKNSPEVNRLVAIDQSKYATALTSKNAQKLNLSDRIMVVQSKLTDEGFSPAIKEDMFDIIVSNPPYILRKDMSKLQPEIYLYEDLRALDGGVEGLDTIKNIVNHGASYLKPNGVMLLEIDPCHEFLLPIWFDKFKSPLKIETFKKDFNNLTRFVVLKKSVCT